MLDFLATWPEWAVMGLVGGLAGVVGLLIANLLSRRGAGRLGLVVAVAIIAAGIVLGNRVILPAVRDSALDVSACATAEASAADYDSRVAGSAVDSVTTVGPLVVDCDARTIAYDYRSTRPSGDVSNVGWATASADFFVTECDPAGFRDFIDSGWTVTRTYTFSDGVTRTMVANCSSLPLPGAMEPSFDASSPAATEPAPTPAADPVQPAPEPAAPATPASDPLPPAVEPTPATPPETPAP